MLFRSSRECWCRLCDSTFCTSKFCCKSGQEVVFCLFRCQNRYRRKYSECICRQEDYVFSSRCSGYRTNNLFDVIDRVRYTSILCYALVVEVDLSVFIQCYVLKKSISLDRIVNVRLRVFVKVDNFCIASALEVEDTVVIPAMLEIGRASCRERVSSPV